MDAAGAVGGEDDGMVVRAGGGALPGRQDEHGICLRAEAAFQVSGEVANLCIDEYAVGANEPCWCSRQETQRIEQDGTGRACAHQAGLALARSVAHPYADGVAGRDAHRPGIAEAVAGAGLPGHGVHGGDGPPVDFLRAVDFGEGFEHLPGASGAEEVCLGGGCCFPGCDEGARSLGQVQQAAPHAGVGRSDVPQGSFRSAQDEREPVVRGRAVEGGQSGLSQEFVELGHAVLLQEVYGGDVQRAGQCFRGGDGSFELPAEILRGKSIDVDRYVRQQGVGQDQSFFQGCIVEEGLQDAACAARCADDVYLAAICRCVGAGVSTISYDLVGGQVDDQEGQVAYVASGKFPAMSFGQGLQL